MAECSAPRLHKNLVKSRSHRGPRSLRRLHFQESAGSPSVFELRSHSATFQSGSLLLRWSQRCSGGSTAQPLEYRRVLPALLRGQVRTGTTQPSVQTQEGNHNRDSLLSVHVRVGADLLGVGVRGLSRRRTETQLSACDRTQLQEVKSWGCPNSLFRFSTFSVAWLHLCSAAAAHAHSDAFSAAQLQHLLRFTGIEGFNNMS